jgi:hypothetical protein
MVYDTVFCSYGGFGVNPRMRSGEFCGLRWMLGGMMLCICVDFETILGGGLCR